MLAFLIEDGTGHAGLVDDHPDPEPGPGDALVRVRLAGICGTDLELIEGYTDWTGVLGHEFVGTVLECPSRPQLEGTRVVGGINVSCGACATCRAGRTAHCPWRTALGIRGLDGAFAERLVLPAANLLPVPHHVTDEQAVFAEPLAAACRVLEQATLADVGRAVVVGDGRLGLLVARVLAAADFRVTVLGRHRDKLDRVAGPRISTATDPSDVEPGAALVVEATGRPSGLRTALDLVRPTGLVVVKTTCAAADHDRPRHLDWNRIVVDEIRLTGSRCGTLSTALAHLAAGTVPVDDLIDARYALDDIEDALDHAGEAGVVKVLVAP